MPVKIKPISVIKAELGIEPNGRVHRFFTDTCKKHIDKYVPKGETGNLRRVVNTGVDYITYEQEYAHAQYIGYTKGPVRNYTTPRNRTILGQTYVEC